jgi:hypothetical protein
MGGVKLFLLDVMSMIELPMTAFCLMGNNGNDKIEVTIKELLDFPERTSFEGGYDFIGDLNICAGSYSVKFNNYFSTTGILHTFLTSLLPCCNSLKGTAKYRHLYEDSFYFVLKMKKFGHAMIEGEFREYPHLPNKLVFEFESDQTCIQNTILELKLVEKLFGDGKGLCSEKKEWSK